MESESAPSLETPSQMQQVLSTASLKELQRQGSIITSPKWSEGYIWSTWQHQTYSCIIKEYYGIDTVAHSSRCNIRIVISVLPRINASRVWPSATSSTSSR
eukprot:214149-Amphidinium_carterae.1